MFNRTEYILQKSAFVLKGRKNTNSPTKIKFTFSYCDTF